MIKKLILGSMQTNCYVVYNDVKDCLVVDPGANGQKVVKYLEDNELNLKGVFLTHGHFDHIGAVDYLYDRYHVDIYTHQETFELLKDPKLNLSFYDQEFVVKSPVLEVKEHMNVAGFDLTWFLLEGHCQGSSMIYFKDENAVMSGDVLFAGSIGRFDFPTSSRILTKQSLQVIKSFDFDAKIYPGHGEDSTLSYEQKYNPYLQ